MKHYSRENDRNQSRIAELERRRDTCEAGVAALEACWTQVDSNVDLVWAVLIMLPSVDQYNTHIGEAGKSPSSRRRNTRLVYCIISYSQLPINNFPDLFDLTSHDMDPTYMTALRSRMQATEQLVTAIVHLGSRERSMLEPDDVYKKCRKTETEVNNLLFFVSGSLLKYLDSVHFFVLKCHSFG